jgi:alkanesulfonate monooxygenase SsuD/methylene tetrahydromethanopterin reductase-like flavin-dependent oxidoreductase (luciferase family)
MVCRPTRKEADEYFHHLVYDLGDWDGIDAWVENGMKNRTMPYKSIEAYKERQISGMGTFLVRGSYDDAAETFKQLHDAGVNGMAVGFIDVPNEVEALINEVLPRMERLGLRTSAKSAVTPSSPAASRPDSSVANARSPKARRSA